MKHYGGENHWKWVANNRRPRQEMSELGKAVANVLGFAGRGIYNAPIKVDRTDWSDPEYIRVTWGSYLSNFDAPDLSALWVECHRRMLRVTISGVGPGFLRLEFWQRRCREGGIAERLPDCEDMIAIMDKVQGRENVAAARP